VLIPKRGEGEIRAALLHPEQMLKRRHLIPAGILLFENGIESMLNVVEIPQVLSRLQIVDQFRTNFIDFPVRHFKDWFQAGSVHFRGSNPSGERAVLVSPSKIGTFGLQDCYIFAMEL
jgi:hypothetical protein